MKSVSRSLFVGLAAAAATLLRAPLPAATSAGGAEAFDPRLFAELRWRCIGPFRGGRTVAGAGIPSRPNVFFIGVNNGGVWKTTDAARTWVPIFDGQPTQSIGALAVAPSNPDIVYVGSGEGLQRPDLSVGDGIYKSTDGGRTWRHLGLRDARQIAAIVVDPGDPNRLLVAALGHPYGANAERGVFRSTNGGETFEKVLYRDENTGAVDLALDPRDPHTVFAALWAARQGPWEYDNEYRGPGSGLFRSRDGGTTWAPVGRGLPTAADGLGRVGAAIAPSDPKRMYALADAKKENGGLFRSDDGGEIFRRVNTDERIWGRGMDFACVRVDPRNPDVVWVANISTYRSTDGGATFTAVKGAPGGDDYHGIWINPNDPDVMLLTVDQGATVTVNGGKTWSSWYNQPTGQMFHVTADDRFPYWVYGGQQESGSAGVASRGNDGRITFRDWHTVGVEEYGYAAPDPLHPGVVYGGKVTRYDEKTGNTQEVGPVALRTGKYRFDRTAPILFSPTDPRVLYFAANVIFRTADGGRRWDEISPDLTRPDPGVPATLGVYAEEARKPRRGVIYAIGLSPKDGNTIWAGTDDGLVHVTRDGGKTWKNVTPPELTPWSKVTQIDASPFDAEAAYVSVSRFRLDDLASYAYATKDGGKSWRKIAAGLEGAVNVVREDPVRRGLLYAGTERGVFVSFDDGERWQSLQQNLPTSSVRDLIVKGSDLVVATHGRSFWILDDVAPLRQLTKATASARFHLFAPPRTVRLRHSQNTDTPLPPEEPAGENPPDGAILDYVVGAAPRSTLALEIRDAGGALVRRFTSADASEPVDPNAINIPTYWIRPPQVVSAAPGAHRFVWDLHYPAPPLHEREFPIAAVPHDTPRHPLGPAVPPGDYRVTLSDGATTVSQTLTIVADPRLELPDGALARRFELARGIAAAASDDARALARVRVLRRSLAALGPRVAGGDLAARVAEIDGRAGGIETGKTGDTVEAEGLVPLNARLATLYGIVEGADADPTPQARAAFEDVRRAIDSRTGEWNALAKDVAALNARLRESGLPAAVTEETPRP